MASNWYGLPHTTGQCSSAHTSVIEVYVFLVVCKTGRIVYTKSTAYIKKTTSVPAQESEYWIEGKKVCKYLINLLNKCFPAVFSSFMFAFSGYS